MAIAEFVTITTIRDIIIFLLTYSDLSIDLEVVAAQIRSTECAAAASSAVAASALLERRAGPSLAGVVEQSSVAVVFWLHRE